MPTLHVHLQTGFDADTVEVYFDDETVYQETDVLTPPMLGIASEFEIETEAGKHSITVRVPNRGTNGTTTIQVARDTYLGVSLEDTELAFHVSSEPFEYM